MIFLNYNLGPVTLLKTPQWLSIDLRIKTKILKGLAGSDLFLLQALLDPCTSLSVYFGLTDLLSIP